MAQVISLHVGQAGVQIGSAVWELYCLEHGIQPDGLLPKDGDAVGNAPFSDQAPRPGVAAKKVPRCLFVDTDPSTVDEIRTGTYRHLFNKDCLISGREDCSDVYARGHNAIGKELIMPCLDAFRRLSESCDSVKGVTIFHSCSAGTGSGLAGLLLERLAVDYSFSKSSMSIWPSPQNAHGVVEQYNAALALQWMKEHTDATIMLDNEALHGLCHRNLDMERPSFTDTNRLIAQLASSATASFRFDSRLSLDITQFSSYLVPYPSLHFFIPSIGPLMTQGKAAQASSGSLADMTCSALMSKEMMLTSDLKGDARHLAACLLYRGDAVPKDVVEAVGAAKSEVKFTDWAPGSFKCSITERPAALVPGWAACKVPTTVCTVNNSTAISDNFQWVAKKFDKTYSKRAFVHWFVSEGMEEGEFSEARENVEALQQEYKESVNRPEG